MKNNRNNRKQNRQDVRFARQAGKILLQWEEKRAQEIESRLFLLTPEAQERLERIQHCVRAAKIPPVSFKYDYDPMFNQVNITLEEYVFSNYSYSLTELLDAADSYNLDALTDGRLVLSLGIHDAAYEMEA